MDEPLKDYSGLMKYWMNNPVMVYCLPWRYSVKVIKMYTMENGVVTLVGSVGATDLLHVHYAEPQNERRQADPRP